MDKFITVLIAGMIGYFTNYLAIKMLFRPLKEWRIGKIKLPFTPGIIPKNRKRIQESLSKTITDKLLNKEDLIEHVMDYVKNPDFQKIVSNFMRENTLYTVVNQSVEAEKIEFFQENLKSHISKKILKKYHDENMGDKLAERFLDSILSNIGMLKAFMGGIKPLIKNKIDEFVGADLENYIQDFIQNQIDEIKDKKLIEYKIDYEIYQPFILNIMEKLLSVLFDQINLEKMIYDKIDQLELIEFEHLLLGIMKKELRMITYLGGILGILIGMINIFI